MRTSNRSKVAEVLKKRRGLQKVLKKRTEYLKNVMDGESRRTMLPLLGLQEITEHNKWVLESILVDGDGRDAERYRKKVLDVYELIPALIDLTPANYEFLRGVYDDTFQSLSYIINRLIEACRYGHDWEIPAAKPDKILKAISLVRDFEREAVIYARRKEGFKRARGQASEEDVSEPGHGNDGASVV